MLVIVEPVEAGWTVHVEGVDNPMLFTSGRAAERAGRDLALRLAESGQQVELHLRLRGGAVAAKFVCLPPLPHEDAPLMMNVPPIRSGGRRDAGVEETTQDMVAV